MYDRVWLMVTEYGLHSVYATEMAAKAAAWDLRYKFTEINITATEVK